MVIINVNENASKSAEWWLQSLDAPPEDGMCVGEGVNLAVSSNPALEL